MSDGLKLFVAHPHVLDRVLAIAPRARLYSLTAGASLAVLPIEEGVQDQLHKSYGTGEWLEAGISFTTTDLVFAARVSETGPLAMLETDGVDGSAQCSALWIGGQPTLRTAWLDAMAAGNRSRSTWPINAALRGLGIAAAPGLDEATTVGLTAYRSNADILARALPLRRQS